MCWGLAQSTVNRGMLGHFEFLNALKLRPGTEVYSQINTGVSRMRWDRAMASKMLTPSQVPAQSWLLRSSCRWVGSW